MAAMTSAKEADTADPGSWADMADEDLLGSDNLGDDADADGTGTSDGDAGPALIGDAEHTGPASTGQLLWMA